MRQYCYGKWKHIVWFPADAFRDGEGFFGRCITTLVGIRFRVNFKKCVIRFFLILVIKSRLGSCGDGEDEEEEGNWTIIENPWNQRSKLRRCTILRNKEEIRCEFYCKDTTSILFSHIYKEVFSDLIGVLVFHKMMTTYFCWKTYWWETHVC